MGRKAIDTKKYDYTAIVGEIRKRKEKKELSIRKMSEMSGVSTFTISHMLRGETAEEYNVHKVAASLGIDILKYARTDKPDVKVHIDTAELERVLMPTIKKCIEAQFDEFLKTHAKKRRFLWS